MMKNVDKRDLKCDSFCNQYVKSMVTLERSLL